MITGRTQIPSYDKIFKENMDKALPGILKSIFKLNIASHGPVVNEIQHTIERRPDLLKKITDEDGQKYLLHVEFQTGNDCQMIFRMAEYFILLLRKHNLNIKQYVVYLGNKKSLMKTCITRPNFDYHYILISLNEINYKNFLTSQIIEEKILALLGNFEDETPANVIEQVIEQIISHSQSPLETGKYLNQLRVLTQLRNLEIQFDQIMEPISTFFKEEKDVFYKRGFIKGKEDGIKKGIEKGIENSKYKIALKMKKAKLSNQLIMQITGLSKQEIERL